MTLDVKSVTQVGKRFNWQAILEAFCVCRRCGRSFVVQLHQKEIIEGAARSALGQNFSKLPDTEGTIEDLFEMKGYVTLKDRDAASPPEFVDPDVAAAFQEGAICASVNCFNAAGTMFRLALDLATQRLLPPPEEPEPNKKVRRDLGLRLPWLFAQGKLPRDLEGLATCVKDDGNDGAHRGTLTEAEAADLMDFTRLVLERLFTEPGRIKAAEVRRAQRNGRP
jgi:hypothetical protein